MDKRKEKLMCGFRQFRAAFSHGVCPFTILFVGILFVLTSLSGFMQRLDPSLSCKQVPNMK